MTFATSTNTATTTANREDWLTQAADILCAQLIAPSIERLALNLPRPNIAVSIGHPKTKKAIGECWARQASEDGNTNQIFITPFENNSTRVLDVLLHELIHAYDDLESGHKGRFALIARDCGLDGKLTATTASPELNDVLADIVDVLGDIPHQRLNASLSGQKKQTARMLKIECVHCGLTLRASRMQIERIYANTSAQCPCCNTQGFNNAAYVSLTSA